jgi:hypothetical protein
MLATLLLVTATTAPAFAVSVADIVQLAKSGLSDNVLVALIQTDNTVFPLDAERILELRAAGLSERVIIAMLRNGRPRSDHRDTGTALAYEDPAAPHQYVAPNPAVPHVYDGALTTQVPQAIAAPVVLQTQVTQPALATPIFYVPYPIVTAPRGSLRRHGAATGYRGFGRFINDGWVEPRKSRRSSP